jgi:hypothetical protein
MKIGGDMKYAKFTIPLIALLILTTMTLKSKADVPRWYAGRYQINGYGGYATIFTNENPPFTFADDDSGMSSWVSLPKPWWIQAGWRYYHGWSTPRMYSEYNSWLSGHFKKDEGPIGWNSAALYLIENIGNDNWCAYIDGDLVLCDNYLQYPPSQIQAYTEVHYSTLNEIDTLFADVGYKDSSMEWTGFDSDGGWKEDFPYGVRKWSFGFFHTYRKGIVYLSLVMR